MRFLFTILLFISYSLHATTYYVSNAGNDADNGTTTSTSWQTISKVNSFSFVAGDVIRFKAGDTWNERLKPLTSGTSGNPITFTSYGTGAKPIITGFQTVTMTSAGSNIWTATVNTNVNGLNTVMVNGVIRAKGRYPNSGYLTQSGSTSTQLNNTGLTGTPNYTGGEAVVRAAHWILNKSIISSQSGATLNLSTSIDYTPPSNYGFFIQNIPSVLDQAGEWSFNSTTKLLSVYSVAQPTVQVSFIDTLAWVSKRPYIVIDGFSFTGANATAIQTDTSTNVTIQNNDINWSGSNAITSYICRYLIAQNNTINNSFNNGAYVIGGSFKNISDNSITNSGIVAGMGQSGEGKYCGIYSGAGGLGADDTLAVVQNNRIDNIGYNGIMIFGSDGLIKQNRISNFCMVKDDGGGIYPGWSRTRLTGNIISQGYGAPVGATGIILAAGIYIDGQDDITIDSNTVFDCVWAGAFINQYADRNNIRANTFISSASYPIWFNTDHIGHTFKGNICYSSNASYQSIYMQTIPASNSIDSNYYLRPISPAYNYKGPSVSYFDLAEWRSATGYDAHSIDHLNSVTSDAPLFYYNAAKTDTTITLVDNYFDAKGTKYIGSITLKPYTSALLFKALETLIIKGSHRRKQYTILKSL